MHVFDVRALSLLTVTAAANDNHHCVLILHALLAFYNYGLDVKRQRFNNKRCSNFHKHVKIFQTVRRLCITVSNKSSPIFGAPPFIFRLTRRKNEPISLILALGIQREFHIRKL